MRELACRFIWFFSLTWIRIITLLFDSIISNPPCSVIIIFGLFDCITLIILRSFALTWKQLRWNTNRIKACGIAKTKKIDNILIVKHSGMDTLLINKSPMSAFKIHQKQLSLLLEIANRTSSKKRRIIEAQVAALLHQSGNLIRFIRWNDIWFIPIPALITSSDISCTFLPQRPHFGGSKLVMSEEFDWKRRFILDQDKSVYRRAHVSYHIFKVKIWFTHLLMLLVEKLSGHTIITS